MGFSRDREQPARSWCGSREASSVLLVLVVAASASAAPLRVVEGQVVHVHDGDSLTVLVDDQPRNVRLYQTDAPELDQPYGRQARAALESRVLGKSVRVTVMQVRDDGLLFSIVQVEGPTENDRQVAAGWAWRYSEPTKTRLRSANEDRARAARQGLWAGRNPIPPWEWRQLHLDQPDPRALAKNEQLVDEVLDPELVLAIHPRRSRLIRTRQRVSRISITDPGVVEVVTLSPTELELIGGRVGQTTLTLWFGKTAQPGTAHVLRYLVRVTPSVPAASDRRRPRAP